MSPGQAFIVLNVRVCTTHTNRTPNTPVMLVYRKKRQDDEVSEVTVLMGHVKNIYAYCESIRKPLYKYGRILQGVDDHQIKMFF